MNKKIFFVMIMIFIIPLNFGLVSAVGFSSTDTFISDSSSGTDAKTFVDRNLTFTIQSSNIMVACYDWYKECGGTTEYQICFAASQQDFDDCEAYDSWLTGMGYNYDSTPETREMDTSSEAAGCIDARYYKNCDGQGGGEGPYGVDEREYSIFSIRFFDCENGIPSWYTYDAKGYVTPDIYTYHDEISCPVNKKCSEEDDNVLVYTYDGVIPNPCRWDEWQSCSIDDDCWTDKCEQSECSTCSDSQCTSAYWNSCTNNNALCCAGDPVFGQYYCEYYETWTECTTETHTGCQQKGSYYCTYEGGDWRWRTCTYGCLGNSCKWPDIDVSPDPLIFNIDI